MWSDEIQVITTIMWQLCNASQILVSLADLDSEKLTTVAWAVTYEGYSNTVLIWISDGTSKKGDNIYI